jgi:hypothetical protein
MVSLFDLGHQGVRRYRRDWQTTYLLPSNTGTNRDSNAPTRGVLAIALVVEPAVRP